VAKDLANLLIYHIHDNELKRCASNYLKGILIDIGCGPKPYRQLLAPYITEHIGVDHEDTIHNKTNIDLFGTAYNIPAEESSFDSAICTAVLEHLEEPEQALRECHRVLKPGGVAVYSAPFIWPVHEKPRDFYRYSRYGLEYLFGKAGFEIIELKALSGFWVTFGQLFVYNLYRLNCGPLKWLWIIKLPCLIIQFIAYWLDKFDKTEDYTWMYMVVARKK
jgi:SAM-dependent methyltransferase